MTIKKGLVKDAASLGKALLFIPLAKIDETQQTVTGIVTAEVLDKAGEIFHYETSVPYFKDWSASFERVSKGKSKGNVRSMHQPNAVGKIIDIVFDDANKSIIATAKIIDQGEWQKVAEGVYTGFSIGGSYVKQWEDPATKKNYFTANPVEISIVDNPCVPVAHFTAIKMDGAEEQRKFKLYEPTNEEVIAKATELAGKDGNWMNFIEQSRAALKAEHGIPDFSKVGTGKEGENDDTETNKSDNDGDEGGGTMQGDGDGDEARKKKAKKDDGGDIEVEEETEEDAEEENAAKSAVRQVWIATDGQTFQKKADCVAHQATIKPDLNPVEKALKEVNDKLDGIEKSTRPYGDIAYAIEKDGVSLYPIDTEFHIRSSWVFANKSTKLTDDEKAKALEAIEKAWADIVGGKPPSIEQIDIVLAGGAKEAVKSLGANDLEKSFWTVSWWCHIVDDILCASDCVGWSHDDSTLPQAAKDICAAVLTFMVELVQAEVGNAMAGLDKASRPAELSKFATLIAQAADSAVEKAIIPVDTVEKAAISKLEAQIDELKKTNETQAQQLAQAIDGFTALSKRVETIMKQPEPRPALTGRVVSKEEDRTGLPNLPTTDVEALKSMIEEHGTEGLAKLMIKLSQQRGITPTGSVRM